MALVQVSELVILIFPDRWFLTMSDCWGTLICYPLLKKSCWVPDTVCFDQQNHASMCLVWTILKILDSTRLIQDPSLRFFTLRILAVLYDRSFAVPRSHFHHLPKLSKMLAIACPTPATQNGSENMWSVIDRDGCFCEVFNNRQLCSFLNQKEKNYLFR